MTIRNSKVNLNGIDLQVDTNGVKPYSITIVDDSQDWLSRAKRLATRADDDSQAFEVQLLSGKRVVVSYSSAVMLSVPTNNNDNINQIYRRYLEQSYQLTGQGLSREDANSLYTLYHSQQILWAKRQVLITQLQDPDITVTAKNSILSKLSSMYTELETSAVPLQMMGSTFMVYFAEGTSFQLSDWVIGAYVDFSFNLIYRTLLEV